MVEKPLLFIRLFSFMFPKNYNGRKICLIFSTVVDKHIFVPTNI